MYYRIRGIKTMRVVRCRKSKCRTGTYAVLIILTLVILSQLSLSEPTDTDNNDGTRLAVWSFDDIKDYTIDNITLEQGTAELSLYESSWLQETSSDFSNGMNINNLNISPDGDLSLSIISPVELLMNGGFDKGTIGSNADNWTSETAGNVTAHNEWLNETGGFFDNGYCWRNSFIDPFDTGGYVFYEWLNQSFYLPSIPLSINISAYHNFTNNSYLIDPGSFVGLQITNLNTGEVSIINSTLGFANKTYLKYENIYSVNEAMFQEPGFYNFTMYTFTDSRGNKSHTQSPTGIWNYWDNASVIFTAYESEGSFTSNVFDAGSYVMWKNLSWNEEVPSGTDIVLRVRTGNTSVPTDSVWSDWSAPFIDSMGSDILGTESRYIQYMVNFTTASTNLTPVLNSVNISYLKYYLGGVVETRDLSSDNVVNWGYFSHSEETNDQVVTYEYSLDSGSTWHDVPSDGDLREIEISVGSKIRFRALLNTTDTMITPSINEMRLLYVSRNPVLTLEGAWNTPEAESGDTIRLNVYFNNTAPSVSSSAWLTIYLDANLIYVSDSAGSSASLDERDLDNATGTYNYHFVNIARGDYYFWIDAQVRTGIDDGTTTFTIASIDYLDPIENRVDSFATDITNTIVAPVLSLDVDADTSSADVGDNIHYVLHVNNTGKGSSPVSWVNGTLDERFEYVNSSIGEYDGSNLSWQMGVMPGGASHTLHLNVSLKDNVVQNVMIPSVFHVDYSDASGYMRRASSAQYNIIPELTTSFDLEIVSQAIHVQPGDSFVVTIYFNNSGYGKAPSLVISMIIPEGLILDSSSVASTAYTEGGEMHIWTFDDVVPGTHSFTITFKAKDISGTRSMANLGASMKVTDPAQGELDAQNSNPINITTERTIPFSEKIYWPWSGLLLFILLSILAYILWSKYKPLAPNIDDAFLIYKDGRLISHQKSPTHGKMRAELDGDIVSAMLTAVQQFVNDSLDETGADKMRKLEFGDRELFMERGENIYIAIMYSGSLAKKLDNQITGLIKQIEEEFPELKAWNGRMKGLERIDDYLMALIMDWQRSDDDIDNQKTQ